jgi:arylsulfatase A
MRLPVFVLLLAFAAPRGLAAQERPPNIVIIFTDDMGYGDIGSYGHPTIRTPHLDRMAQEGTRFTQFYVAASVCTPSRAGLLTGRLPVRSGMSSDRRRVLFPNSAGGLPHSEITIAGALKEQGYATAAVGKWHLGHLPEFLPRRHGFDYYFGIPYSNDMDNVTGRQSREIAFDPKPEYWNVPLLRNEEEVERPADQYTITRRYTEEAVAFIREHRDRPFFVYLAHSMPHIPLFTSDDFAGRSRGGLYGDVIEEIDWSVGRVLDTLRELNLGERTFVFFTSDNGPWLIYDTHGGTAGLLREGKGSTWEGGMRVPAIAWWPGTVEANRITPALGTTMDLFSTSLALAGAPIPGDRVVDGVNLMPILTGELEEVRDEVYFYRGTRLFAVRKGPWKAHFITQASYGGGSPVEHETPELYHLEHDPSERFDVAAGHPDVIEEIRRLADVQIRSVVPVVNQLER